MYVSSKFSWRLWWGIRLLLVSLSLVVAPVSLPAQGEAIAQKANSSVQSQTPKRADDERTAASPSAPESKAIRNEEVTVRGQVAGDIPSCAACKEKVVAIIAVVISGCCRSRGEE